MVDIVGAGGADVRAVVLQDDGQVLANPSACALARVPGWAQLLLPVGAVAEMTMTAVAMPIAVAGGWTPVTWKMTSSKSGLLLVYSKWKQREAAGQQVPGKKWSTPQALCVFPISTVFMDTVWLVFIPGTDGWVCLSIWPSSQCFYSSLKT